MEFYGTSTRVTKMSQFGNSGGSTIEFLNNGWGRISLEAKGSEQFQNIICVQNWVYLHMLTGFSKEMLKKNDLTYMLVVGM